MKVLNFCLCTDLTVHHIFILMKIIFGQKVYFLTAQELTSGVEERKYENITSLFYSKYLRRNVAFLHSDHNCSCKTVFDSASENLPGSEKAGPTKYRAWGYIWMPQRWNPIVQVVIERYKIWSSLQVLSWSLQVPAIPPTPGNEILSDSKLKPPSCSPPL